MNSEPVRSPSVALVAESVLNQLGLGASLLAGDRYRDGDPLVSGNARRGSGCHRRPRPDLARRRCVWGRRRAVEAHEASISYRSCGSLLSRGLPVIALAGQDAPLALGNW